MASRSSRSRGPKAGALLEQATALRAALDAAGRSPEDPCVQQLLLLAQLGRYDLVTRWLPLLEQEGASRILQRTLFASPATLPDEGIPLATLADGRVFRHPTDELTTGVLCLGAPKSGKTTAVCSTVERCQERGIGVLIPDVRGDYLPLAVALPRALLLPAADDRINVLRPPEGMALRSWLQVVSARLTLDLDLQKAGQTYCLRMLLAHAETSHRTPTLLTFRTYLEHQTPRRGTSEEGYRERVLGRLQALLAMAGEEVFSHPEGFPVLKEVEQGRVVVSDLRCVDKMAADFLVAIRLYALYYQRLNSADPFHQPLVLVVLDEQRSLIRAQSQEQGVPDKDLLFSRARAMHLGFLIAEQLPSVVSPAVLTACRLRLGFNAVPPEQREVGRILGLTPEQTEELGKLPAGTCIARLAGNTLPDPFLLRFPQPGWMA